MSSLNVKTDGSLYVEVNQLRTVNIPRKLSEHSTAYDFENANEEVYEHFKKHMLDKFNCKVASHHKHELFFNVIEN